MLREASAESTDLFWYRTYALELEITAYSLETAKVNTSQIAQNGIFRL